MKVVFVVHDLRLGGVERLVLNILSVSKLFKKKKIQVDVASFYKKNQFKSQYPRKIISKVKYLNKRHLFIFIRHLLLLKQVRILDEKNKYDTYVLCEPATWFLNLYIKYVLRKKTILMLQIPIEDYLKEQNLLKRIFYLYAYINMNMCSSIICPSEGIKYNLKKYFPKIITKVRVIPNFVILKNLSVKNKKGNCLFACGRLVKQKGFDRLIRSFYQVIKNISDARLIILGNGPERSNLLSLIKSNHLQKNVSIVKGGKPTNYYNKSNIFVLSSYFEGFATVIIEAMVYGLPIIATDCNYGPKEILSGSEINYLDNKRKVSLEKYGILVSNTHNDNILAKYIILLLKDNDQRKHYSKMSLLRKNDYLPEKIIKLYCSLFIDINYV